MTNLLDLGVAFHILVPLTDNHQKRTDHSPHESEVARSVACRLALGEVICPSDGRR